VTSDYYFLILLLDPSKHQVEKSSSALSSFDQVHLEANEVSHFDILRASNILASSRLLVPWV